MVVRSIAVSGARMSDWLEAGTKVEVLNSFDGRWRRGFSVEAVQSDGYLLRRHSDGAVLPKEFPPNEVRRERKQGLWWA